MNPSNPGASNWMLLNQSCRPSGFQSIQNRVKLSSFSRATWNNSRSKHKLKNCQSSCKKCKTCWFIWLCMTDMNDMNQYEQSVPRHLNTNHEKCKRKHKMLSCTACFGSKQKHGAEIPGSRDILEPPRQTSSPRRSPSRWTQQKQIQPTTLCIHQKSRKRSKMDETKRNLEGSYGMFHLNLQNPSSECTVFGEKAKGTNATISHQHHW